MDKLEYEKQMMSGDCKFLAEPEVIDKINEIVEFCNSVSKLIDYADNERKRDKE